MNSRRTTYLLATFVLFGILFLVGTNIDWSKYGREDIETQQALIPVRLIIPKISVDAPIQKVGITENGLMDVPKEPMLVGWLSTSSIPAAEHPIVMDGHRGWRGQLPAVFDRLYELKAGDRVYVAGDDGKLYTFIVGAKKTYLPGDDASNVFLNGTPDTNRKLNLITCDGNWDANAQTYATRLVVFAERE